MPDTHGAYIEHTQTQKSHIHVVSSNIHIETKTSGYRTMHFLNTGAFSEKNKHTIHMHKKTNKQTIHTFRTEHVLSP